MDKDFIRNFCIIAHIDHGKSTLADRFLEITKTVEKRKMRDQILDQMDLERERGITIKLQPVRMRHEFSGKVYELNLIDTPGHVDFTYEVSRSLQACEGAILVVDATQGIQAQTLANMHLARSAKLQIIPVVNKIDLPNAQIEETVEEISRTFAFSTDEIILASGKTGDNVDAILQAVITRVPAPQGDAADPLQALIFDSKYDKHRGVVTFVRVMNGSISQGKALLMMATGTKAQAAEVGFFSPDLRPTKSLEAGEVGYVVTGLRDVGRARVGDTITLPEKPAARSLPGYRDVKPMVFASIFPSEGGDYHALRDAMEKLKLNDGSLYFEPETAAALGFGFRAGFLGLLHLDITTERLKREFALDIVVTAPSVAYAVKKRSGEEATIYAAASLPDPAEIAAIAEPWVRLEIVAPHSYLGAIMGLAVSRRGVFVNSANVGTERLILHFEMPLAELISDFYDKLKSVTAGYGSMNYEFLGYREADLVKLDILAAYDKVNSLSVIVPRERAESEGRRVVEKLKGLLPRQQFPVALQAAVGGKVLARETIPALRKDVTAKLYGGDVTRKMKLLQKQKKGKKRLTKTGRVEIPKEVFLELMKK